jgi:3-hydroxyisobutyrate dehydrogenase-like beta-hydroxyacid dehydrogenase
MKVGFVGAGKMGSGMARNLLRAGHEITVYNRTRNKAEALQSHGGRVAGSPAEAAHDAEAVFTMLADDQAVADAVLGDQGIASVLKKGAPHISSSTISISLGRRLAEEHGKRGQAYLAAPVFGRPEAAEKKQLIVVAAGDRAIVERLSPLFEAIGRKTFIAGDVPWQANAVKVCGNFMIASMLEAFSEAFATTRKAGVDRHLFLDVMSELFGSPVYKNYGQIIADEKFQPAGFGLKLGLKDVRLVLEAAQELGAPTPFASVIRDQLISAIAHGQEALDWSSIALVAARSAGLEQNTNSKSE